MGSETFHPDPPHFGPLGIIIGLCLIALVCLLYYWYRLNGFSLHPTENQNRMRLRLRLEPVDLQSTDPLSKSTDHLL
jgi:hypothetical protein